MRLLLALAAMALASLPRDTDRVTAMVTVAGGAHAGTYFLRNVESPCEITRENAPRPKHEFDVMVGGRAPSNDSTKLTVLLLTIPDADVKGANTSFSATIIFGDVGHGTRYEVETRPGHESSGSGTVSLASRGQDATITFEATSANGVAYKGTMLCVDVSRN